MMGLPGAACAGRGIAAVSKTNRQKMRPRILPEIGCVWPGKKAEKGVGFATFSRNTGRRGYLPAVARRKSIGLASGSAFLMVQEPVFSPMRTCTFPIAVAPSTTRSYLTDCGSVVEAIDQEEC